MTRRFQSAEVRNRKQVKRNFQIGSAYPVKKVTIKMLTEKIISAIGIDLINL